MRDNTYLESKMYELWENHFDDIPRKNLVLIKFGRRSKRQLGSIRWVSDRTKVKGFLKKREEDREIQDDKRVTLITITQYFQDLSIPEEVVLATIAHEMVHYAHGFHSPLKQLYKHPHRGNIVEKEMISRGMEDLVLFSKKWLDKSWVKTLRSLGKLH